MKLHELRAVPGATRAPKRKGRGTGTGNGTTAGRGMNGQRSRSGGRVRPGFEGGQMPLYRRLPKRGFTNIFKKKYNIINIGDLELFEANTVINEAVLLDAGLLTKQQPYGLRVLGSGELTKPLTVQAAYVTASAKEAIEKAGGKVEVL